MSRYRDSNMDCKIYVGDLGSSASKQDLEDAFGYYGHLRNVWVARNPPGFAFVEFEDARDAEDAVRGLDGRTICGRRVRVELSNKMGRRGRERGPPPRRGRPFRPEDRCYTCGERGHYARDCHRYSRRGRRSRTRSRSRSRSDRRSRSRSNSKSRSRSRSKSSDRRSKSKSSEKRYNSKQKSKSHSKSKSRSRSRSRGSDKPNGHGGDD